ncbi:MAG: sugar transferase [Clostridia bacterium]|nr:sugar transferase [Clostridia bacterium]
MDKKVQTGNQGGYRVIKRFFDIVLSFIGIVILLVPMSLIMLMVIIDDPGSPIFSQKRVGRNGELFNVYKLRTMKKNTPKYLATKDVGDPDKYITKTGRILRKLSVDELPQLINILKGDMSIVGPRPLIPDEKEIHILREQCGVYSLRPGLTGLAQINGRDLVSAQEKVAWDEKYLNNISFKTDIKILLATVPKVFGGENVVEGFDNTEKEMSRERES